jgi:tRNA threonylcarbamoyladenosine biosynthesis protein TsaE
MRISFTLKEINKIAEDLIKNFSKKKSTAFVVAFFGDLGSGKTTLTQGIAKILGVKENIISPTYIIIKKYKIENKNFKFLIHIDAYRLKNSQELFNIGWKDLIENRDNLIIIEWPELVPDCINKDVFRIYLEHKDKETRILKTLL